VRSIANWLFEGLHLTQDIPSVLAQGGFEVKSLETMYLAAFPKSWTHGVWGTAIPAAGSTISKRFLLNLDSRTRSFDAAVAIEKLLRGAKWSLVQFLRTLFQTERMPNCLCSRFFVVAHDIETAALRGALQSEGTDDDVASRPKAAATCRT